MNLQHLKLCKVMQVDSNNSYSLGSIIPSRLESVLHSLIPL